MKMLEGKPVFGGIAVGRIVFSRKRDSDVRREEAGTAETEILRFEQAKENAKCEFAKLYDKALRELGEESAAIFEMHQMILDDPDFVEPVVELIEKEKVNAEYAVAVTCGRLSAMFEAMDDEYMKARSADVKDIGSHVAAHLSRLHRTGDASEKSGISEDEGKAAAAAVQTVPVSKEPVILAADALTPSEMMQLDRSGILAIVTRRGSINSHAAILAGTMKIPALTGVEFSDGIDGHMGILDGYEGLFCVDPDDAMLEHYRAGRQAETVRIRRLSEYRNQETVTGDGRRIRLCANIGSVEDAVSALQDGVDGIGLFRSEFLYLGADDFPTEEEQFEVYRAVAEKMAGKEVIIRTLDLGADKDVAYLGLPHETNPALGCRGIRLCLERPDIFRTQLRAILRAGHYGTVSILYPMIVSVDEVRRAKKIVGEVKAELDEQNIPYGEAGQGIMIETPAAVWLSQELSREADFFSIGTNDLMQYMLAADRQDPRLEEYFDPHHPAVLDAVRTVIANAHRNGIRAGICGEMAADTALTEEFLRMGVDELSVSPAHILSVRAAVCACNLKER